MAFISTVFANVWKGITVVLAVIATGLFILLQITKGQEERARRKAQSAKMDAAISKTKYQKAKQHAQVMQDAEQKSKDEVAQARARARAGKRDHFDDGMRDD